MDTTQQTRPAATPAERTLPGRLARPTVRRLFETWAEDMARLAEAAARGQISEGEFFALHTQCVERLAYYAADGELARDVARLTSLLAAVEHPSGGAPKPPEQDISAPESDSGTEVATSNSKRMRKIRK
ncbi:MAG TPA: hypothetical protein P5068_18340 [Sedimentisphaerales bacterium]|nr:hypothetical protein [Sedimentisphaerales bacterium]